MSTNIFYSVVAGQAPDQDLCMHYLIKFSRHFYEQLLLWSIFANEEMRFRDYRA